MRLRDRLKIECTIKEIDHFILDTTCRDLITISQQGPWHQSNFGSRKIFSLDHSHLPFFENLVQEYVPHEFYAWQYYGIHPASFQIFRYDRNDEFPTHTDKEVVVDESIWSLFTLVVYLNHCSGGQTVFPERGLCIEPCAGKAVIFPQNLMHASNKILKDQKYILRGQVLYQKRGEMCY